MSRLSRRRHYGLVGQAIATLLGASIWGTLFAVLGGGTCQAVEGAAAGVAIGALIGFLFARGRIGPLVPCTSLFAFLAVAVCLRDGDSNALPYALAGVAIGAVIAATGARGVLATIGGFLGVIAGAAAGDVGVLLGLLFGAELGWYAGHAWSAEEPAGEQGELSKQEDPDR